MKGPESVGSLVFSVQVSYPSGELAREREKDKERGIWRERNEKGSDMKGAEVERDRER